MGRRNRDFASQPGQLHSSGIGTWAWQAWTGTPTLELIGFSAGGDLIRATWYSSRPSHCPCCRKHWNLTCAGKEPGYMRKDTSTLGNECRFRELAGLGSVQILQTRHQAWLGGHTAAEIPSASPVSTSFLGTWVHLLTRCI